MSTKERIIEELDRILQVKNIAWNLLPEEDLSRLFEAFQRLKAEVDEVFALLDEITDNPLTVIEDTKKEWKNYVR